MSSVSQSLVLQSAPQRCSIIEASPNACFDSVASAFAISAFNSLRNSSSPSSSRVHPSLTQRQGSKLPKCLPSNLHNILFGRATSFFVIPGSNACRNASLPYSSSSSVDSSMTQQRQEPLPGYLPKDLFGIILSYSGIEVREECYTINGWQKFAWQGFSWAELGPKLTIFDEKAWEMHVDLEAHELDFTGLKSLINIEGNVPNTVAAIRQVHKMLSWENKRDSRCADTGRVTLLTVPKGLTLAKLWKIAETPKIGYACPIVKNFSVDVLAYEDDPTKEAYIVAIKHGILEEQESGKDHYIAQNLGNSTILHMATLTVTAYMRDQTYVNKNTLLACKESSIDGKRNIFISFNITTDYRMELPNWSKEILKNRPVEFVSINLDKPEYHSSCKSIEHRF